MPYFSSAITNELLLTGLDQLQLPKSVRMALFGFSYLERGKMWTTAAQEYSTASQAILLRLLLALPDLHLPTRYPTMDEFFQSCAGHGMNMQELSLRLGKEKTFVSRARRLKDAPHSETWTLMALIANSPAAERGEMLRLIERFANQEAAYRGIPDIDEAGTWNVAVPATLAA